ncbi:MAG: hypothetical protein ACN6QT_12925 [Burkholderia contaminans]|uniref:Uncharacterized protein n=1 Tax=Burkholderia contaminans TaxID=488447 RepID=A0AAP4R658_9BURK|nr:MULTISPECIES: hypothetical protein [Burkholderia]MBD1413867.1 hypothetical protein [Burkholderia contaminans]MBH9703517.1 hypothetical protein [Burkholderia contaminans]MBM6426774.1 hypothetical protein [Burkholderia contaminans]MCA7880304.1 hypothetical protein [Burkholderia contaminans]MDN7568234.1 hypothetical protein [Burkholderia contaminans]
MEHGSRFLHVGAGRSDVYREETHFQIEGWVGATVVGWTADSYLACWENVAAEVDAARMEDWADPDKIYTPEVNTRLGKLVGPEQGFLRRLGVTCKALFAITGIAPGPDEAAPEVR